MRAKRRPNIRLTGKPGPRSGLGIILATPDKPLLLPSYKMQELCQRAYPVEAIVR